MSEDRTTNKTEAFIAWTKEHPGNWPLGVMRFNGKAEHFLDRETDSAWMGFCGAWAAREAEVARLERELVEARDDARDFSALASELTGKLEAERVLADQLQADLKSAYLHDMHDEAEEPASLSAYREAREVKA